MIISNVVEKQKYREVQTETLKFLSELLNNSFGPNASNSKIVKSVGNSNIITNYTKDGHTILKSAKMQYLIEESVRYDLEELTLHIVKTVGDGTTSAVILADIIFNELIKLEEKGLTPYEIIEEFKSAVKDITEEIKKASQEFNADKAYDIALISTNGSTEVASHIQHIYEKFGKDVFIDVAASIDENHYLKEYDGMTLNSGYSDVAYINNIDKSCCTLRKPRIYIFEDPIDTNEMMGFFISIIEKNIIEPSKLQNGSLKPTVIIAPKISRDMGSYIQNLVTFMLEIKDVSKKPPILVISDVYQKEELSDLAILCGCKTVRKYINHDKQKEDIESGVAPTKETIVNFYGEADIVESDVTKTKFVNPKKMKNEDGSYSTEFTNIITYLEAELKKAYEEQEDNNVTGSLKRRINSLKANMVEYLVGGISIADRDNLRDLVEDAVLNCRSAARNGVGYGANFEGLKAASMFKEKSTSHEIIYNAYLRLISRLYLNSFKEEEVKDKVKESMEKGMPINLKSKKFDGNVLSSIDSDIVILNTISKIVTLMFTSNQFICPTPVHNTYSVHK